MTWSSEDHERCARKLASFSSTYAPPARRRPRAVRPRLTEAELAAIDAIVADNWASASSVDVIASMVGRSPPFISARARALGLPARRPDRRRPS